ncbi:DUF1015 domain-containing protein [Sphingobacteriales bacterium UPWRP_1]|nr:hypothetical protein B6N25_06760 [Sphingobacteriales bacterium TSM_CSS]PSJ73360.1 DUF1015 domain-containing protein [Sphingobacteriales bacterium UPWRP_1]
MTTVKPFASWRPVKKFAPAVASRPYDVLNRAEAKADAQHNPYSFLHVTRAEIDLPDSVDEHDASVYRQAKTYFNMLVSNGVLEKDKNHTYYIYAQTMNNRQQIGIAGLLSVDDCLNGLIKKHELTRPEKEKDRTDHMLATGLHAEPVLMTYKQHQDIDTIVNRIVQVSDPVYDFTTPDGVQHTFWTVTKKADAIYFEMYFANDIPAIYIADGHHRVASATRACLELRKQYPNYNGSEGFNFFPAVLFPGNQLHIMDYNRVVKDLNGMQPNEFLQKLEQDFTITTRNKPAKPAKAHEFGMYLNKNWYQLVPNKQHIPVKDPIASLDVSILSELVLSKLLNIKDQRTDKRIDFVGGIRGMAELEQRVNSGEMSVAFAIHPVTVNQLINVADSGNIMPPKSTWFEPKLRSGLLIHQF